MRKTFYCLILIALTVPLMGLGLAKEQANLMHNGQTLILTVVPVFTFLLGNLFILLFDKEDQAPIIIASSLAISFFADLITLGYYDLELSDLNGGLAGLVMTALVVSVLTWAVLTLYALSVKKAHVPVKN